MTSRTFDDATLVAERHKSAKALSRFFAAVKALHPNISSAYDRNGVPSPSISLLMAVGSDEAYDADALAGALVEYARRFAPEQDTVVASISADTDRVMTLTYVPDGSRGWLTEDTHRDGEHLHAVGTLTDAISAAVQVGRDDAAERDTLMAAEMAAAGE